MSAVLEIHRARHPIRRIDEVIAAREVVTQTNPPATRVSLQVQEAEKLAHN